MDRPLWGCTAFLLLLLFLLCVSGWGSPLRYRRTPSFFTSSFSGSKRATARLPGRWMRTTGSIAVQTHLLCGFPSVARQGLSRLRSLPSQNVPLSGRHLEVVGKYDLQEESLLLRAALYEARSRRVKYADTYRSETGWGHPHSTWGRLHLPNRGQIYPGDSSSATMRGSSGYRRTKRFSSRTGRYCRGETGRGGLLS